MKGGEHMKGFYIYPEQSAEHKNKQRKGSLAEAERKKQSLLESLKHQQINKQINHSKEK